jgi:L-ascorbate metabolism protein UlaG (beta-lactamase superfamily)
MNITQLRNATIVIDYDDICLLVDPMLADAGGLPPLKLFDGERLRNPIVELPENTEAVLSRVTHCLITHCQKGHFDHLDRAGKRWLREKQIPVLCTARDASYLRERGLLVQELTKLDKGPIPFFKGQINSIPCRHGSGIIGRLMEHGVGYFIRMPGHPSLYLAGDTVMTPTIREFVASSQPEVSVIPAGGARFEIGGEIIMDTDDVHEYLSLSQGMVIANHFEALSHCPITRKDLHAALQEHANYHRLFTPLDGEVLCFE